MNTKKKLDIKQKNNLMTGNDMAAEILSSNKDYRVFTVVSAYIPDHNGGIKPSKILNPSETPVILYRMMKYEVHVDYIKNDLDITEDDLKDFYVKENIPSIEELEVELCKHLEDLSLLGSSRDNPF